MQTCPKCAYTRKATDTAPVWQCPSCGIAYAKFGQFKPDTRPVEESSESRKGKDSPPQGLFTKFGDFVLGHLRAEIIGGIIFGIIVLVVVGPIVGGRKDKEVETSLAPVVAVLESYKAKKGSYPVRLDFLVPAFLAEVPRCPESSRTAGYDVDSRSGDYELGCPTFLFSRRHYSSATKSWGSSDD